jgi:aspartate 1-decarboxylase
VSAAEEGLTTKAAWIHRRPGRHIRREVACPHAFPVTGKAFLLPARSRELRTVLKSKIHRATVTQADLHYEGSITLDPVLMEAADILPFEQVHVLDVNNGARLTTYAIEGARGSGQVCINGAAARLVSAGDTVIILTYDSMDEGRARDYVPALVYVDGENRIVRTGSHIEPAPVAV